MAWAINHSDTALKELKKLDKGVAREILDYLDGKIAALDDPTTAGKPLTGKLATYWRYRERDHRVICHLDNGNVTVTILSVPSRSLKTLMTLEPITRERPVHRFVEIVRLFALRPF